MRIILLILISLMVSCISDTKAPTEVFPRVTPKEQDEYQVHMGSHHLINANSIKEAQQFIEAQSVSHGGEMRIIYVGNNVPQIKEK